MPPRERLRQWAGTSGHDVIPEHMELRYWIGTAAFVACVHASGQARLEGTITDETGASLPYASVGTGDGFFGTQADASGHFVLGGLKPGVQRFKVALVGYTLLDTTISLIDGTNAIALRLRTERTLLRDVEVSALRAGDRAPFAKTVMSKEDIARVNTGVDLPYILDLQPNVVSTSDAGTGIGYTYMRIRGSDGTRTNITVNGVPFNDAESQGAFLVDMPDIATSAEDIELQRGVGTSTNGPGAFGASLNIRTTSVKRDAWGQVAVSGGSFNTQRYSASAGTGLLNERFSLDVRLSSISSDGYIDRATADLKSYFLQGAWVGAKRSLRFITFRGKENTYQAWGGVPLEVIDTNRTYNPYYYENQVDDYDQSHYQLLFDQKLGTNASMNITLFRVGGSGYYEQLDQNTIGDPYGLGYSERNDVITRKWLDNTFTGVNASVEMRAGAHRLVLGGNFSDYEGDHFGEVIWARFAGTSDIRHRYYENDAHKTDANAFAKLTYAVSTRLDVFGDLQVRSVEHTFLGYDNDLENIDQTVQYTFFNPKAGLLWRMGESGKAHGSVAVANREPNRDDLVESTPDNRAHSERLIDYELGYEQRSGRAAYGINAYFMDYDDQLVLTGELNDVGAALRTNVPKSYRAGLELSGTVRIGERMLFKGNLAFSRNRVIDFTQYVDDWDNGGQQAVELDERDLAFSPNVVGGGELGFRFWGDGDRDRAAITWVMKYVGPQYLDNTANDQRMLDPYLVNDLRLNVMLGRVKGVRSIDLNITVRNLFSELYESNGWSYAYLADGQQRSMIGLYPQAPLNFLGGVTVNF